MTANLQDSAEISLVEAAQRGHLESFAELYKRYHSPMVALAYSMLSDRHHAEDAAQEVFAVACRDLPRLKSKEKFAAWLAGICRNVSRQMLRTKAKSPPCTREQISEPRDNTQEWREAILRAVWNLNPSEREIVVMRYFDDLSQARIGEVLHLSRQAVNGRLVRAKRKIATNLQQNGFAGVDHESG